MGTPGLPGYRGLPGTAGSPGLRGEKMIKTLLVLQYVQASRVSSVKTLLFHHLSQVILVLVDQEEMLENLDLRVKGESQVFRDLLGTWVKLTWITWRGRRETSETQVQIRMQIAGLVQVSFSCADLLYTKPMVILVSDLVLKKKLGTHVDFLFCFLIRPPWFRWRERPPWTSRRPWNARQRWRFWITWPTR